MPRIERRLIEQGRNTRSRRRHHGAENALDRRALEPPSIIEPLDPIQSQRHGLRGRGGSAAMSKYATPTGTKPGEANFVNEAIGMIDGIGLATVERGDDRVDADGETRLTTRSFPSAHQAMALRPGSPRTWTFRPPGFSTVLTGAFGILRPSRTDRRPTAAARSWRRPDHRARQRGEPTPPARLIPTRNPGASIASPTQPAPGPWSEPATGRTSPDPGPARPSARASRRSSSRSEAGMPRSWSRRRDAHRARRTRRTRPGPGAGSSAPAARSRRFRRYWAMAADHTRGWPNQTKTRRPRERATQTHGKTFPVLLTSRILFEEQDFITRYVTRHWADGKDRRYWNHRKPSPAQPQEDFQPRKTRNYTEKRFECVFPFPCPSVCSVVMIALDNLRCAKKLNVSRTERHGRENRGVFFRAVP